MTEKLLYAHMSGLWAQPDGPNTKPEYLGCHDLGDVANPRGDLTRVRRPNRAQTGEFRTRGSYRGAPGTPTVTVTTDLKATADYLEKMRCPASIFVMSQSCGRRDVFLNYERVTLLRNGSITNEGLTGLAVADEENKAVSRQSFDFGLEEVVRLYKLTAGRQVIGATGDLRAIHFCNPAICAGECGPSAPVCTFGVAVGNSPAASVLLPGEVWITDDGGATWVQAAADPFAADEDIAAGVCFQVARDTTRILVARGTTDVLNPAEVSYSDDEGATWTPVDVGSTDGQFVLDGEGLFVLDQYNIWLATNDGYIYKSEDGGLSWTAQESGVLAATGWNAIEFVNEDDGWVVGDNNEIAVTEDGGTTWTAVTGPAGKAADEIEALAVVTTNRVFIGFSDGQLWYTENKGEDWYRRPLPVAPSIINDIGFRVEDDHVGFLVYTTAAMSGGALRTFDGGYTWETVPGMPSNSGLMHLHVCDPNTMFAVGAVEPAQGGMGVVMKVYAS